MFWVQRLFSDIWRALKVFWTSVTIFEVFASMYSLPRTLRASAAIFVATTLLTVSAWAAPAKPQIQVTGYVIDADLDPAANRLTAKALVTFTALEDLNSVTFELNNGLQLTKLTDAANKP